MLKLALIPVGLALLVLAPGRAEDARPAAANVSPAPGGSTAEEQARLQALPASHIPLKGATLASAIRLLAGAAQMSYLAPPDADFAERVTSDVTMSPYALLRVLSDNYHFGFEYRDGVWRFYRINLNELVTKVYTLRFNNLQQVSIATSSINSQLAAFSGGGGAGGGAAAGAGGGASPSAGGSTPSGAPASSRGTFEAKTSRVIEDIKKILGIPTVGLATPGWESSPVIPGASADRKGLAAPRIEPIWNPDTSQLFVVATRQQHSLIGDYLKTIDQPQKLIRISVKFVETARDPSSTFGVDWSQTLLGSGGPITLAGAAVATTATGASNAGIVTSTTSSGGTSAAAAGGSGTGTGATALSPNPLATAINLANPGKVALPISLLSAPAFQLTLQAIASDQRSSIVQDPVLFTSNNREVTFKATTEQPIQEGSTTFGSASAATSSQIAYIEVGTQLTVLPSLLPGRGERREVVLLSLSINVSTIVGQQVINGNPYPVTSTRTYSYSVPIPNGQTLAIAGLEQRSRQTSDSKIPLLGDIPFLGYAFKSRDDRVVHSTLLAFITPEVVSEVTAGEAESGNSALPVFRHRVFTGAATETMSDVHRSLEGLPEDIAALQAAATAENKSWVLNRLDQISVELALIDVRLGELRLGSDRLTAREYDRVERARERLAAAQDRVRRLGVSPLGDPPPA